MRRLPDTNNFRIYPEKGIHSSASTGSLKRIIAAIHKLTHALAWLDWRSMAAFSLPMLLYWRTLAPTIYNLDSAELSTAAYTGGLMRATGYPLYLSIGYLWSRIPIGDVGYRMNLLSAVCGALTVLLADRVLRRWSVGAWAALGALGLLATSTFFWGLSLVAEVYTLHTALMAGLILALMRWGEKPSPRRFAWVGLIGGLGAAHHAAIVLLIPGSLFYVLAMHPRQAFSIQSIAAAVAGMLVGLSFFLYLPLRYLANPVFNYAGTYDASLQFHPIVLTSLSGFWWLISGKAFAGIMLAYSGAELRHETWMFVEQLWRAFFTVGIIPGMLGLVLLWKGGWRQAGMLSLMFALSAGFYINYRVMDKDTMYLPAYMVWALWVGIGYQAALDWLKHIESARLMRISRQSLVAVMASWVLLALAWNWRIVDLSKDRSTRERGEAILEQAGQDALVFGWWDTVTIVQYLQLVEGQRPDVKAINRFLIAESDLVQAIDKEVQYRPIYIDSSPHGLPARLVAISDKPIYRIQPRAQLTPFGAPQPDDSARRLRR